MAKHTIKVDELQSTETQILSHNKITLTQDYTFTDFDLINKKYADINYISESEKNQPNGVAGLDPVGLLPSSVLPPLATTETFTVASDAAMTALVAQRGDYCVRTDYTPARVYILAYDNPAILSNWILVSTGSNVITVNGQSGPNVLLTYTDINAIGNQNLSIQNATFRISGSGEIGGTLNAIGGAEALKVGTNTGNPDHAFIGFYARTATPTTRSGSIGYLTVGSTTLSIFNTTNGLSIATDGSLTHTGNRTGTAIKTIGIDASGKIVEIPGASTVGFVTLDTVQTITGAKTFTQPILINGATGSNTYTQYQIGSSSIAMIGSEFAIFGSNPNNFGIFTYGSNDFSISTSGIKQLIVTGTGNIGIGTTNPISKLDIRSSSTSAVGFINISNSNASKGMWIYNGAAIADNQAIAWSTGQDLRFGISSDLSAHTFSELCRITSSGNVGIGVTPTEKLHVAGSALFGTSGVNTNATKIYINNNAGKQWALSAGVNLTSESTFAIYNWTDQILGLTISSSGNVGINEPNPTEKLHVAGAIALNSGVAPSATSGLAKMWSQTAGVTATWVMDSAGNQTKISGTKIVSVLSGTGAQLTFTIAHGITGYTPNGVFCTPNSANAAGFQYVTVDATNITVTYSIAPPNGSNNLRWTFEVFMT